MVYLVGLLDDLYLPIYTWAIVMHTNKLTSLNKHTSDKKRLLNRLYKKIHACIKCDLHDDLKVLRNINCTNVNADVFVISQAPSRNAIRFSGINFHKKDGSLCATGKALERFLNKMGRTVQFGSNCVYNTELVQCYPGSARKGDKLPPQYAVKKCHHFLIKEIQIIKPKLIFLMGKKSWEAFYNNAAIEKSTKNFSDSVGEITDYEGIPLIPIQHASTLNPRFAQMLNDDKLIKKINKVLKNMNTRRKIETRNRNFLKTYLNMSQTRWHNILKQVGPPKKEFSKYWTPNNPSSGWCGSVTKALMLSGKIPPGYIPCKHKTDAHYYFINPDTEKVIDLTIYQMAGEYENDYTNFCKRIFRPVVDIHTSRLMQKLDLKLDYSNFKFSKHNNTITYRKVVVFKK